MRNDENFQPLRKPRRAPRSESTKRIQHNNALGQARTHAKASGRVKVTFLTKAEAETHLERANASPGGLRKKLHHAYRCPYCSYFHTTSITQRFRMRLDG